MSTPAVPVAVGSTRRQAADVFGPSFDRLLLTTYVERADEVPPGSGFVGIAADPDLGSGMGEAIAWGLGLLAADPALGLAVELPRDPAVSAEVADRLEGADVRVVGVRRFGDHPCLVLAAGSGADDTAPTRIAEALTAAVQQRPPLAVELDDARQAWELAAHQQRSDHLERQIRDVRVRLARRTAERNDLRQQLERLDGPEGLDGPGGSYGSAASQPPRAGLLGAGRRQRVVALTVLGLLAALVLLTLGVGVRLLVGGGALRTGLALALLVLVLVLAALGGVAALLRRVRASVEQAAGAGPADRADLAALIERVGGIEAAQADLGATLDALPDRLPPAPEPDLAVLGDRIQSTATLYALAPPTADVPPMPGSATDLAVLGVAELLSRRPQLAVVTGSPDVALFLALAARRHQLVTRVVALDDDAERASALTARADRHGIGAWLESRHAPLTRSGVEGHRTGYYAPSGWDDLTEIGLAVVGGPDDSVGPGARLPFVPLLADRLAADLTVLLPDAHRAGDLAEPWARVLGVAGTVVGLDILAFRR